MIQTLGDVLLLVAIVSLGLVSFLLAVFLYHLIFVVMDLRQVMKRMNDITAEIEDMLMKPVEVVSQVMDWVQKLVWDFYVSGDGESKKENKKKSKKKKKKEKKEEG